MAVSVLAESQDVTFAEQARHLLALAKPRLSSLVVLPQLPDLRWPPESPHFGWGLSRRLRQRFL